MQAVHVARSPMVINAAMREMLTPEGYEQAKAKLRDLETRLADLEKRSVLDAAHLASIRRSYKMVMREYLQEIKRYEAHQGPSAGPNAVARAAHSGDNQQESGKPRALCTETHGCRGPRS
jgi:hypothetical protein